MIAEHVDSGVRIEQITNEVGRYLLVSMRVGMYVITVDLSGFRRVIRSGVVVQLGQTLTLDFALDVGGPTEEVRVIAETRLLQTGNAEISDVIENQQVVQLPLNGRNFLALAQLSDAVVIPPGGTRGEALQQAGPLPNVGGQRSGHNIYMLDGVKVTDELFNNLVINPSVDSIEEFKIQKSQYPAEFGGKASALINVATRAGTNAMRGTPVRVLPARHARRPQLLRPEGPAGSAAQAESIRRRAWGTGCPGSELLLFQLRGTALPPLVDANVLCPDGSGARRAISPARPICDPSTITTPGGACTPFPNSRIPEGRLDPLAVAFLQHVPLPTSNAALQNLTSIEQQVKDLDQLSLRLDHRFGSGDQLFARFSTFDANEVQPFGSSSLQETLVPGFGRTLNTKARNLALSHTRVIGRRASERTPIRVDATSPEGRSARTAGSTLLVKSGCRASRSILGTSAILRSRRAANTARSAIRRRSRIATTSTSRSSTTSCSTAEHIASSSAGTSSTCSSGPSSQTTRAASSPTPVSSPAMRSPISCSGIRRPPSPVSDAAMRMAERTGSICSPRTTGGFAAT